jgi:transposase
MQAAEGNGAAKAGLQAMFGHLSRHTLNLYKLGAMDQNKTTLERAFELAKSGVYANLDELRMKLKAEGYDLKQTEGTALRKQLNLIMQSARTNAIQ